MTPLADKERRTRITTYVLLGVVFVLLAVVGLFVFRSAATGVQAQRKADELADRLAAAGLPVPSDDQIVRTLGDDGGAVCADPNSALVRAGLHAVMTNGAGGPGARPVIADDVVVQGVRLVIETYCPDQLPDFTQFTGDLTFDDVAAG